MNTQGPLVTVIIPVYNAENYIHASVHSILAQSYRNLEILVINDASTDKSSEILELLQKQDPRIRVLTNEKNKGLVGTLNLGLKQAQGSLIARIDADDLAFKNRIELQVSFLDAHPKVGLVGTSAEIINERDEKIGITRFKFTRPQDLRWRLLFGNSFFHSSIIMRKSVSNKVGEYRLEYLHAEDYDYWLRILRIEEVAIIETPLIQYRQHSTSISMRHQEQQLLSAAKALSAHLLEHHHLHMEAQALTKVLTFQGKKKLLRYYLKILISFSIPVIDKVKITFYLFSHLFLKKAG